MTLKKRLSTVNKKRKWATGLGSLLAAVWLLSCTGPVAATRSAGETVLPSATTSSPTPISSPTTEPTPTPSSLNCGDVGSLMFAREYSLYMACADGSAEQEIVPAESWLPDASYFLASFALSPDGEKVAVSGNPTDPDLTAGLFVIQLADGSVTQLHHAEGYVIHNVSWSPDGEYIGYVATPGYYDRLEVLHVESRTISQVATAESISGKANWVVNILSFDWSPRGTQIVYVAFLDGRPPEINGYIADVDCTSPDHICRGSKQRRLPWMNSWGTLTWAADGLSLSTGDTEYTEAIEISVLEIRRPSGELLRRVDLTDHLPGMRIVDGCKTPLSPDGNRIAFFMEGDDGGGLFVLNLSTLETTRVARRVNPVGIQWVPGK
jgi:hypothetical protein